MFVEILSSSIQHSIKLKLKSILFAKLIFVKPLPVPLTSILELNVDDFSNLLTIFNPSLILLAPPVKITIFELFLLIYFMFDSVTVFGVQNVNIVEIIEVTFLITLFINSVLVAANMRQKR